MKAATDRLAASIHSESAKAAQRVPALERALEETTNKLWLAEEAAGAKSA